MVSIKFLSALITPHWKVLWRSNCAILLLLRCPFRWYHFQPKSTFSDFCRKPWTIVHGFDQISFRTHNSSLEGAMKIKLCHSAPLEIPFTMISLFAKIQTFRYWQKTMDYSPWLRQLGLNTDSSNVIIASNASSVCCHCHGNYYFSNLQKGRLKKIFPAQGSI